jgi:hypothetical protein
LLLSSHISTPHNGIRLLVARYSVPVLLTLSFYASAYDINDQLSVGGVIAGAAQYQDDDYHTEQGPSGWAYGLRAVAEF